MIASHFLIDLETHFLWKKKSLINQGDDLDTHGDRRPDVADIAFAWCEQAQVWEYQVNIEHSDNLKECFKFF